ncbi:hypothetical protein B0H13DRAFT_2312985 [Mycena leptocephala]|nr:hypothetical protein B0H13DRAFT_2312985 [Mycena leptocephala]
MIKISAYLLAALVALMQTVTAASISFPAVIPDKATSLLLVDNNTTVVAFDIKGAEIGRYKTPPGLVSKSADAAPAGQCALLTQNEFYSLPYLKFIQAIAPGSQATGNVNTDPTYPAYGCVGSGPFLILKGATSCDPNAYDTTESIVGASGEITLRYPSSGVRTAAEMLPVSASKISAGFPVSISFGMPDLTSSADRIKVSTPYNIQNKLSPPFDVTIDDEYSTQGITLSAPVGAKCSLGYTVSQCFASGNVRIPFVASGWVDMGSTVDATTHNSSVQASIRVIITVCVLVGIIVLPSQATLAVATPRAAPLARSAGHDLRVPVPAPRPSMDKSDDRGRTAGSTTTDAPPRKETYQQFWRIFEEVDRYSS